MVFFIILLIIIIIIIGYEIYRRINTKIIDQTTAVVQQLIITPV